MSDLEECQRQRRKLIARQSTIRAAIERLQVQASGDDSDYGMGILHAVSTILAAVQDLEDGTTPAPQDPDVAFLIDWVELATGRDPREIREAMEYNRAQKLTGHKTFDP